MKKFTFLIVIVAGIIIPGTLYGQVIIDNIPRDTSFTVSSSAQKISKDFPYAVPVREFKDLHIHATRDIVYASIGKRKLHADIFLPEKLKGVTYPVVICVHGGGWASGSKSHLVPLSQKLAELGYAAISIEYRLSPEAKYPAAVSDIHEAIEYIIANAKEYNVDTTRIAILGTSAGATLASLVGTTSGRVHAIINIDGVLDFTDPAESGKDSDPEKPSAAARWFGSTYKESPAIWINASPISYVDKNTPPTLFINSAIPRFHAGRGLFLDVLEKYGIYYQVHTIPETPHPFWLFYPWFETTLSYVEGFLSSVFE